MKIALKIDVDTFRGTREGVPALLSMLERHGAGATFLFSLGPDHTGRAIKRALRPGFMQKVGRTSVLSHYGVRTLLYGTVLPGPDIGRRCADVMRDVKKRGFEVGIHTWDHVRWQDGVATANEDWTRWQMSLAVQRFTEIFGQLLIECRQGLKQNTRIIIETHPNFVANCRATTPHLVGLPEPGYLRHDRLLVFF